MNFLSLMAKLGLDASEYKKGLDEAGQSADGFADRLKGTLATAAQVGAAAVTAAAAAAGAMTTAIVNGTGAVAAYGDNIDKASQKLGISAQAYQEWDAVLQHSGTSIDSLGIGMKTLANAAESGSDAFAALGISQKQAASMSREQLFEKTITALQSVRDENRRAQLATELFGKSAMELGPLLNTSAADTQAMREEVHRLGGVLSDDIVKASATYQDTLQDMTTAMDGWKNQTFAQFLPGLTDIMAGVTEMMKGNVDAGRQKLQDGVRGFLDGLQTAGGRIVELARGLLPEVAAAIAQGLPMVVQMGAELLMMLVQALVGELPTLARAGVTIIITLANALSDTLPELIPAAVEAIIQITEAMTDPDNLLKLMEAGIRIIMALGEGLINALPRLLEKGPVIINNLFDALIRAGVVLVVLGGRLLGNLAEGILKAMGLPLEAVRQIGQAIWDGFTALAQGAFNWGKDMILNFWEGIKAFISYPIRAVQDLAGKIKSFLGFSEPEQGPLSNFHTYAPDMMALFAQGVRDNAGLVTDAIGMAFDVHPAITAAWNAPAAPGATAPGNAAGSGESPSGAAQRPIQIIFEFDGMRRFIYNAYNAEKQRVGVQLAGVNG